MLCYLLFDESNKTNIWSGWLIVGDFYCIRLNAPLHFGLSQHFYVRRAGAQVHHGSSSLRCREATKRVFP